MAKNYQMARNYHNGPKVPKKNKIAKNCKNYLKWQGVKTFKTTLLVVENDSKGVSLCF